MQCRHLRGRRRPELHAVQCRHLRGRRRGQLHSLRAKPVLNCRRHDLHGVVNVVRRRKILCCGRHTGGRHYVHDMRRGQVPSNCNARQRRRPDVVREHMQRVELRCGPADHGLHGHSGSRVLNVRSGHVPELAAVRLYNAGMWRAVAYMSDWHILQLGRDCDGRPNVHLVHSRNV